MHKLLERQLIKLGLATDAPPSLAQWQAVLELVTDAYTRHDEHREHLERSLDLNEEEMRRRWKLLRQNELIITSILNASVEAIVTTDAEGVIIEFNQSAERAFGRNRASTIGMDLIELLAAPGDHTRAKRIQTEILSNPNSKLLNQPMRGLMGVRADGTTFPAEFTVARMIVSDLELYTLFVRDMTEYFRFEELVKSQQAQIAVSSKMAALGEMAGGIAHEINTPLGIFSLCADNLRSLINEPQIDRDTLLETAEALDNTVQRVSKIIVGLKRFSRDGSRDPMVSSSAQEIVSDAISLCQQRFATHGITIHAPKIPMSCKIDCRGIEISQVILNLLNNSHDAIQALNERWIRVDCKESEEMIELSVTDSGPGIPPEIREKLMQPFFTTKGLEKGTGLGLSISVGIIEAHRGRLFYDPDCANTRFVIQVPKSDTPNAVISR